MRVSKQQAAENRERILSAAARMFRERGVDGVGMDALAQAAGLTHGSLYSQFGSKDQLATEALAYALAGSGAKYEGVESLADYLARYLSPSHRDRIGDGCAVAALAADMPHQSTAMRARFTEGVRSMAARVGRFVPDEDAALTQVATMVGALMLARAVDDPALSEKLLKAGNPADARNVAPSPLPE